MTKGICSLNLGPKLKKCIDMYNYHENSWEVDSTQSSSENYMYCRTFPKSTL